MGVKGLETLLLHARAYQEVDLKAIAEERAGLRLTVDGLSLCHYLRHLVWVGGKDQANGCSLISQMVSIGTFIRLRRLHVSLLPTFFPSMYS